MRDRGRQSFLEDILHLLVLLHNDVADVLDLHEVKSFIVKQYRIGLDHEEVLALLVLVVALQGGYALVVPFCERVDRFLAVEGPDDHRLQREHLRETLLGLQLEDLPHKHSLKTG